MKGRVIVSDATEGVITTRKLLDLSETGRIRLPQRPGAIANLDETIYIASGSNILRLHPETLEVEKEYAAGEDVERIVPSYDGAKLYVLLSGANALIMLDEKTGEWLASTPMGANPRDLRLDRTGKYLVAACGDASQVAVVDADTLATQHKYNVRGPAVASFFAADGIVILSETGDSEDSEVSCVLSVSGDSLSLFTLPGIPTCFTGSMNGLLIGHLNGITMVNLQRREINWRMNLMGLPDLITSAGRMACYIDRLTGRVGVIDCYKPTFLSMIRTPEPNGLIYVN